MDSLRVNAEEIAQVAMGMEYMSVAPGVGGGNQVSSDQDWRNSGLTQRDDPYGMSYQRNSNSAQLPMQNPGSQQQQVPPPRQPYGYNAAAAYGVASVPSNAAPTGQPHAQLKQPFPGQSILGAPKPGNGLPAQPHQVCSDVFSITPAAAERQQALPCPTHA